VTLDLARELAPAATLSPATSVKEALVQAGAGEEPLVLVAEGDRPQALFTVEQVAAHAGAPGRTLADLLPEAHELVVVDEEVLAPEEIRELVRLAAHARVPGVVVLREDRPAGVLSAKRLATALPLGEVASRRRRMYGDPTVPARTFICRTCVPPTRRRPRTGFDEPVCPRNPAHGPMERDS
jgi:CBS domain-containing protein